MLETIFAVQVTLLFNEADVDKFTFAAGVDAEEVSRAPGPSQSGHERSSAEKRFNSQFVFIIKFIMLDSYHSHASSTSIKQALIRTL